MLVLCIHFLMALQTVVGHGLLIVGLTDPTELRCVYVHIYIYIHTYICKMHTVRSTHIRAYIHTRIHTYTHTRAYMHTCIHTYITYLYIYTHTRSTNIHTYIHTYMYIIYVHTHTYIRTYITYIYIYTYIHTERHESYQKHTKGPPSLKSSKYHLSKKSP